MLYADYHTHTKYSAMNHGKGTMEENVVSAIEKGLKEIGFCDHGMNHTFYGVRKKKLESYFLEAAELRLKYPSIRIRTGMETNFISPDGELDSEEARSRLEILTAGYHKLPRPARFGYFFTLMVPNLFKSKSAKRIAKNTDMYLKAIERYPIDIISHPLRDCIIDLKAVGELAAEKGTLLELNGHKTDMSPSEIEMLARLGCRFILGSDAHTPKRVGDVESALAIFLASGAKTDIIENWNKLPVFRSERENGRQ